MEVILDELQTRGVDIDMRTLSHHINYLFEGHGTLYNQMVVNVNPNEMHVVFNTINVINIMATRRVMANSDIIPPLFDKSRKEIVNSSTIGIDFLGNALSNDLVDIIYEGTRLKWCNDLDSLKAFVAEVLDLNGKWCSPGGGCKRFTMLQC